MKSAKEMFEELGYKYDYIQNDNSEDTITYHKDNLNHIYNDDYSIIEVLRPRYERIYERGKEKTK